MNAEEFRAIAHEYPLLRIAVVGDFCLDRYLEIDPTKQETSLETGLPVHNVMNVRAQPGGAGTIVSNLAALGVGAIYPVGFAGNDGEGAELSRALHQFPGVKTDHFQLSDQRRTFTYCKPLLLEPGKPPVELNRLDSKNWTPTPAVLEGRLIGSLQELAPKVQAIVLLDQVDVPETGVITTRLLRALDPIVEKNPELLVFADSRRGLRGYPPVCFKMNGTELSALTGIPPDASLDEIERTVAALARDQKREVFVTLSERGIVAASPSGERAYAPALPMRGPIDIVGAGDAVTANLIAALAAGAAVKESCEIAMAAASVVIHKLGTTGTATTKEIGELL